MNHQAKYNKTIPIPFTSESLYYTVFSDGLMFESLNGPVQDDYLQTFELPGFDLEKCRRKISLFLTEDPDIYCVSFGDATRFYRSGTMYILCYHGLRIGVWSRKMEGVYPEEDVKPYIDKTGTVIRTITDIGFEYSSPEYGVSPLDNRFRSKDEMDHCLYLIHEMMTAMQFKFTINYDAENQIAGTYLSDKNLPFKFVLSDQLNQKITNGELLW